MKSTILFLIFGLFLTSCERAQTNSVSNQSGIKGDSVHNNLGEENGIKISQLKKQEFKKFDSLDIRTLPTNWTRLTLMDSIPIIYRTCDGGNRLITIINDSDKFKLLLHGQQEDYEFEVIEVLQSDPNALLIKAKWIGSDEQQDFKFSWINEKKGLGQWETINSNQYNPEEQFVKMEFEQNYLKVEQPCMECWGEEKCELMKKINNN